jgi:hypothetical protein
MEVGEYVVKLKLEEWFKAAGGLGPRLDFVSALEIVDDVPGKGSGKGKKSVSGSGTSGPGAGSNVALRWGTLDEEGFTRKTVGSVESTPASVLAQVDPTNYSDLSSLGDAPIPTITLNVEYSPLKRYLASRSKELETLERPRDRYAVGVGVAVLLIDQTAKRAVESGNPVPSDDVIASSQEAAARAVLAVMPFFDDIARESGIE